MLTTHKKVLPDTNCAIQFSAGHLSKQRHEETFQF